MISLNRSYMNQIERGKENVSVDVLVKIADGLDRPITDLFDGLDAEPPRNLTQDCINYEFVKMPLDGEEGEPELDLDPEPDSGLNPKRGHKPDPGFAADDAEARNS